MIMRTTVLAALAAATVIGAGGSTVLVTSASNETGLARSAARGDNASDTGKAARAEHAADAARTGAQTTATATPPPCPADVKNHGAYVSSVAQSAAPGEEHGATVSAAAQSDCGKPEGSEQEGAEARTPATGKADKAARAGTARGRSAESHGRSATAPGRTRTTR